MPRVFPFFLSPIHLCFQVFGKNDMWFWVIFSLIHVLASLALSTQIYYMGRFKMGKCHNQTVLWVLLDGIFANHLCGLAQNCKASPVACTCLGLSFPLPYLKLFLVSEVFLLWLPRQQESAGPICCLLSCAPEGCARWGGKRRSGGEPGSCALLTNMFLLPLLHLSASDGPDSGNWQQLPFFEMIEQWWRSWGCMDACGRWACVPPWGWLLRIEVYLPAALLGPAPSQEGDGVAQISTQESIRAPHL